MVYGKDSLLDCLPFGYIAAFSFFIGHLVTLSNGTSEPEVFEAVGGRNYLTTCMGTLSPQMGGFSLLGRLAVLFDESSTTPCLSGRR